MPPDPRASRAVLLGTSVYDHPSWEGAHLGAVRANLTDLAGLLTDERCWGLPAAHCTVVTDPQAPDKLILPIRAAAEQATDTLLVYYAGHGFLSLQDGGELQLTVGQTVNHDPLLAVGYRHVREAVLNSRARRRIVVLDCCFAGAALGTMGAAVDRTPIEGTYVLAAVPPHKLAIAPVGAPYTAFTGTLIGLLQDGIPGAGAELTLDRIYEQLWRRLASRNLPTPCRSDLGAVGALPLVRNQVHDPPVTADVLSVDFGTSNTTAVLRLAAGGVQPLFFDNLPTLPSAVGLDDDGNLRAGRDAVHSAKAAADAFEATPKRHVDRAVLTLGGTEVAVVDAVAAVLQRTAKAAGQVLGGRPGRLVLTHPHTWGAQRKAVLEAAALKAGLPAPDLVSEPMAAVSYLTTRRGQTVEPGKFVVLYDLGGGTFDVSTVRRSRTADGWEVARCAGLDEVGGVNLDDAILRWLGEQIRARDSHLWQRSVRDNRQRHLLREDVRLAKEQLSHGTSVRIPIPLSDEHVTLTRETFEELARELVEHTVRLTTSIIAGSDAGPDQVAAVILIGGSSKIPLVRRRLQEAIGIAPHTLADPELVVAEGALYWLDRPAKVPAKPTFARLRAACRSPVNLTIGAGFGLLFGVFVGQAGYAAAIAAGFVMYAANVLLVLGKQ